MTPTDRAVEAAIKAYSEGTWPQSVRMRRALAAAEAAGWRTAVPIRRVERPPLDLSELIEPPADGDAK